MPMCETAILHAREAYERDGVAPLRGVIPLEMVERLREGCAEAIASPGPLAEWYGHEGAPRFFGDINTWKRSAAISGFIRSGPVGEIAGRVMQSTRSTFFYDQLLVKEAGSQQVTPWHQDQPYWAVSGRQVCSVWVPLDAVDADVSVAFVAGSHRWGQSYNPKRFATGTEYEGTGLPSLPDIDAERDRYSLLSWAVEPGDCIIFNAMTVHGAPANPRASARRVLATRWLGDDARFRRPIGETGFPVEFEGLEEGAPYSGPDYPVVWSQ